MLYAALSASNSEVSTRLLCVAPVDMMKFSAYNMKGQHPNKTTVNADMTCHTDTHVAVLDGVGGVPHPLRAEDLSYDLRNRIRDILDNRNQQGMDRNDFDGELLEMLGGDRRSLHLDPPGGWMARLLHLSIAQTQAYGSTCVAMASFLGNKITYLHVGHCGVRLFRYCSR